MFHLLHHLFLLHLLIHNLVFFRVASSVQHYIVYIRICYYPMDAQKEINGSVANKKPKTPAQLEKERAKAEKVAKFLEKQKKLEEKSSASQTTEKSKSEKKQDVVEYNGSTKAGEKKGIFIGKHSL